MSFQRNLGKATLGYVRELMRLKHHNVIAEDIYIYSKIATQYIERPKISIFRKDIRIASMFNIFRKDRECFHERRRTEMRMW